MASGSFESNTGTGLEIGAEWTSVANAEGNYSTVSVKAFLTHYSVYCAALSGSYIKIGNSVYSFSKGVSQSSNTYSKTYIGSYEAKVSHLSDGTKSLSISVGWNFSGTYNGTSIGMLETSKTVLLDNIPSSSVLTAPSSLTLGEAVTVGISSPLSSNRHRISFSAGGRTYTTDYLTGASPQVSAPAELALAITEAPTATGTLTLHTYNSEGTWTGQCEKTVTYRIPNTAEFIPSFSLTSAPVSDHAFLEENGLYAAGITRARVEASDVEGKYGATPVSCAITVGGVKVNGYSALSDTLAAGSVTVSARVTDSRGFSVIKSRTLKVNPYYSPFVTEAAVYRCNGNGEAEDTGSYLYVCATSVCSELSGNSAELCVSYKHHLSDSYLQEQTLVSGEGAVISAGLSPSSSYDVKLVCRDTVGRETEFIVLIPTALVDMHMKNGSVRFGGYCEKEGFECNWDANFQGALSIGEEPVADFVVDRGEYGVWTWRKWSSGVAECFGNTGSATYQVTSGWGALYHSTGSSPTNSVAYPEGLFTAPPLVQATVCRDSNALFTAPKTTGTAAYSPDYYIVSALSGSFVASVDLYCIGRWK